MRTSAGHDIAAIQASRTAAEASAIGSSMDVNDVGEIGQFLATLLVLQGVDGISEADKNTLIPNLRQWRKKFAGRLASDTSERCLAMLENDRWVVKFRIGHDTVTLIVAAFVWKRHAAHASKR